MFIVKITFLDGTSDIWRYQNGQFFYFSTAERAVQQFLSVWPQSTPYQVLEVGEEDRLIKLYDGIYTKREGSLT